MIDDSFLLGEYRRAIDERYRISIPTELADGLAKPDEDCILAKERPGALSLWNAARWQRQMDDGVQLVRQKIQAGRLDGRLEEVQILGRLLSTRQRTLQLGGRGRLLVPEGFREFLGVEAGGDVLVIGAAICVELWRPDAWIRYLDEKIPEFRQRFDNLSA